MRKIISGGQTGVDRGALDAALAAGFPCGGWCPEGRMAEDGPIPSRYPLQELAGGGYRQRTRQNVIDSDGTLVIYFGALTGGSLATVRFCEQLRKPVLVVDGAAHVDPRNVAAQVREFVRAKSIGVLNVAGPRESQRPGAAAFAEQVMREVLLEPRP
jgi:hypothetical protein